MSMLKFATTLAAMAMLLSLATATNHTVGGPVGSWDSSTDLESWASSESFSVGDFLIFEYLTTHDVVELNKAGYDNCNISNPISTNKGGNTVILLDAPGKRYFVCGTIGHCIQGMKVEIDTQASSTTPPAASPPPSSPSTPPSPTPPPQKAATPPTSPPKSPPAPSPPGSSPPNGSLLPPPPPSSATKVGTIAGFMGFGFAISMLLNL